MAKRENPLTTRNMAELTLKILLTVVAGGISLIWLWIVLVLLGRLTLRPTHASAANFVKAYVGGPLMLFLAAAWIGFVVWVAETLRKLKDIALLMGRFLQIVAVELWLFPLFHGFMIFLTRHVLRSDLLIGGGAILLSILLWRLSRRLIQPD